MATEIEEKEDERSFEEIENEANENFNTRIDSLLEEVLYGI